MLDQGLWHNIFNTDNKEPIKDELKLIAEWERMIAEIEQWEKTIAYCLTGAVILTMVLLVIDYGCGACITGW